jgi:chromosome segregation ATPase
MATLEVAAQILEKVRQQAEIERQVEEKAKAWAREELGIDIEALEKVVHLLERRYRELESKRRSLEGVLGASALFAGEGDEELRKEIAELSELSERYWAAYRELAVATGELRRLAIQVQRTL